MDLATLENLERARAVLACLGLRWQVTVVQVSRSRDLGGLTGLEALNPVFIVSAWREVL